MEPGQVSQSLQSPLARSSSESSLNLTVICDDGTAGVVWPSRPEVGVEPNPNIRLPASTSTEWVSAAAEINTGWEPVNDYHRDGAMTAVSAAVAVRAARNPTYKTNVFSKHFIWFSCKQNKQRISIMT